MNGAKIIIQKELKRVYQDKRLVVSLFILPAVLIIGLYTLIGNLSSSMESDVNEHISSIYIINQPNDLNAILESTDFLKSASIFELNKEELPAIKNKILDGKADLIVEFSDTFLQDIVAYQGQGDKVPAVTLYYNTIEQYSMAAKSKFEEQILNKFEQKLLGDRLGSIELLTVFDRKTQVIVDEEKESGQFFSTLLPYFITFMLFAGAMSLGVDAITGEKERGTMASMLLTPLKRREIVVGKLVSLCILSGISSMVYSIALIIAMPMMMGGFGEGETTANFSFSVIQIIQLLLIMLVMVYLYVALISLIAVLAKTAKEATTCMTPIYIVVIVAGLITMFQGGFEKPLYMYAIPVYGNALAIQNLMLNELTISQFLSSIAGTGLLAVIITIAITRAFNSEKIMFNA